MYETIASTLPTIIGLIMNFKQERGSRSDLEHRDFVEWLGNNRHNEVRDQLARIHHTSFEIQSLLRTDLNELKNKLAQIDALFASLASNVEGLSGLTRLLSPRETFTPQAKKILVTFASGSSDSLFWSPRQHNFGALLHDQREIVVSERRFIVEDLNTLEQYGLIELETLNESGRFYRLTRIGLQTAQHWLEQDKVANI